MLRIISIFLISIYFCDGLLLKITGDKSLVGANVRHGIRAGDWQEVKFAAIEEVHALGRRKRGLGYYEDNHAAQEHVVHKPHGRPPTFLEGLSELGKYLPQVHIEEEEAHQHGHGGHESHVTLSHAHEFQTKAQEAFNKVDNDDKLAWAFQESFRIKRNILLRESVVVNPHGVTCEDVCDSHHAKESEGFGLLGFCTENYCKCDYHSGYNSIEKCHHGLIFDPVKQKCDHPQHSALCSDKSFTYSRHR